MYSKATTKGDGEAPPQDGAGPSAQTKPKDDVVEAEFEEVKE